MDKKKKMMIGVGVIAVVGAYFLFFKKDAADDSAAMGDAGPSCGGPNSIEGGMALGKGAGNWIGIRKSSDRQLATDSLSVGSVVSIDGFCCSISQMWMDKNDRVGALKCEGMKMGEYNFPDGTMITW